MQGGNFTHKRKPQPGTPIACIGAPERVESVEHLRQCIVRDSWPCIRERHRYGIVTPYNRHPKCPANGTEVHGILHEIGDRLPQQKSLSSNVSIPALCDTHLQTLGGNHGVKGFNDGARQMRKIDCLHIAQRFPILQRRQLQQTVHQVLNPRRLGSNVQQKLRTSLGVHVFVQQLSRTDDG